MRQITEEDIKRINELYAKSKTEEGLSEEEKAEQAALRRDYIEAFRRNLRGALNNIDILEPDGSITRVCDLGKKKED